MKEIKRKCQGCNKIKNKDELIKITKLQNGTIKINPTSKELGRSAYVCKNKECIETFIKKKRAKNALKINDFEKIEQLNNELNKIFN